MFQCLKLLKQVKNQNLRLENLEEFKSITASFEEQTGSVNLGDFLEEISLVADIEEHKESNDEVTLMTIHSAKGLEFDAVIITNADVHNYTDSEVDTKLLYVCITRAMNTLEIYHIDELPKLLQQYRCKFAIFVYKCIFLLYNETR